MSHDYLYTCSNNNKKTFHSVQGYYTVEVISCVSLPQYSSSSGRGIIILLNRMSL